MGTRFYLLFVLLVMCQLVIAKRGSGGSSWGRRGSSRGKSSSSTSTSSGGWFSWGKSTSTSHASVPAPAPKPPAPAPSGSSYGWQNPSYTPGSKPAGSYGWQKPASYPASSGHASGSSGWSSQPKPVSNPSSGLIASPGMKPASGYGWQTQPAKTIPAYPPSSNWQSAPKPAASNPSHAWPSVPKNTASNPSSGWQNPSHVPLKPSAPPLPSPPKPAVASVPLQKSSPPISNPSHSVSGSSYGWSNPQSKPAPNSQLPSSNIGAGGYPVQGGTQKAAGHLSPPPYSASNPHGTSTLNHGKAAPPAYSPHGTNHGVAPPAYNPSGHHGTSYGNVAPPAYTGPKKQIINNHYHYNSPSPSHYGMSSSYYPPQNSFGYPGGGYFGNSRPSYGGMSLFSGGSNGFGYPGSGGWGGYSSYGSRSSSGGGMVTGLLIGAAGGYLANSLIRRVTNPWGYSGYGYGSGYMDRYRHDDRRYPDPPPATAAPIPDPTANWIDCVKYDPVTRQTMINPNCTCTVSTTTDPATGQTFSHHNCAPPPSMIPSPPLPVFGVNNPPPSFNSTSLYGDGGGYGGGGSYGYGGNPQGSNPGTGGFPQGVQQSGQAYPQFQGGNPHESYGQGPPPPEGFSQGVQQSGSAQAVPQFQGGYPQGSYGQGVPLPEGANSGSSPPTGVLQSGYIQPLNAEVKSPEVGTPLAPGSLLPSAETVTTSGIPVNITEGTVSEALVSKDADNKKREFLEKLQGMVNMGRFVE